MDIGDPSDLQMVAQSENLMLAGVLWRCSQRLHPQLLCSHRHAFAQIQRKFKDAFVWLYTDFRDDGRPMEQVSHTCVQLSEYGMKVAAGARGDAHANPPPTNEEDEEKEASFQTQSSSSSYSSPLLLPRPPQPVGGGGGGVAGQGPGCRGREFAALSLLLLLLPPPPPPAFLHPPSPAHPHRAPKGHANRVHRRCLRFGGRCLTGCDLIGWHEYCACQHIVEYELLLEDVVPKLLKSRVNAPTFTVHVESVGMTLEIAKHFTHVLHPVPFRDFRFIGVYARTYVRTSSLMGFASVCFRGGSRRLQKGPWSYVRKLYF